MIPILKRNHTFSTTKLPYIPVKKLQYFSCGSRNSARNEDNGFKMMWVTLTPAVSYLLRERMEWAARVNICQRPTREIIDCCLQIRSSYLQSIAWQCQSHFSSRKVTQFTQSGHHIFPSLFFKITMELIVSLTN